MSKEIRAIKEIKEILPNLLKFTNFPKFLKFSVLRSKPPRLIRAPRRRSGQISLPAMTTKSPFAKGGFRGNVTQWCSLLRVIIDEVALSSIKCLVRE